METPEKYSYWKHHNGNTYQIIMLANEGTKDEERYPVTVIYQNIFSASVWSITTDPPEGKRTSRPKADSI